MFLRPANRPYTGGHDLDIGQHAGKPFLLRIRRIKIHLTGRNGAIYRHGHVANAK